MKLALCLPDAGGHMDGPMRDLFIRHLDINPYFPDALIVPCVWHPGYKFNPILREFTLPIILLDMLEFGWDYGDKENRLGHGTEQWPQHLRGEEWDKLDAWVREQPPRLILKRELWKSQVTDTMRPIDFPSAAPLPSTLQSKAEFDARRVEVCHVWGWSHSNRVLLHSDIFRGMTTSNIGVIAELKHWDGFFRDPPAGRAWISCFTPHYARYDMSEIFSAYRRSKISTALPGAGLKTFRHGECADTIMASWSDGLSWAYPWDETNSIPLIPGHEFECLDAATRQGNLYEVYRAGQENLARYECKRYATDYLLRQIESVL